MGIGENLAEARRQAGLSVTEVSQRTCIREAIIRGIEHDDYCACGGDFYARGHIRTIARAVGTDPGPLIQQYDATHEPPPPSRVTDLFGPVMPIEPRRRRSWPVVSGLLLVVLLGAGAYYFVSRHAPAASPAAAAGHRHPVAHHHAAPAAAPAPSPTAPPAAAQPYAHLVVVHLKAIEDCWVEFTDRHGGYLFQAYVFGGTARTWTFHHVVEMSLGNPGGIRLTVDGKHPLSPGIDSPITLRLGLNGKVST